MLQQAQVKGLIAQPVSEQQIILAIEKYIATEATLTTAKFSFAIAKEDLKEATNNLPSNEVLLIGKFKFNRVESANPQTVDWVKLEAFLQEHGKTKGNFLKDPEKEFKEPTFQIKCVDSKKKGG